MRIAAARNDPDAGYERDPGSGRIDRELARLGVDVRRVVAAVPVGVLVDTGPESRRELFRTLGCGIEGDGERLVLRRDQVIGTGRADLADLGATN